MSSAANESRANFTVSNAKCISFLGTNDKIPDDGR